MEIEIKVIERVWVEVGKKTSKQLRKDLAEWLKEKGTKQRRKDIVKYFVSQGYTDGQLSGVFSKQTGYGISDRVSIPNVKRIEESGAVFYEYDEMEEKVVNEIKVRSPYEGFKNDFNQFDLQLQKSGAFNIDVRNSNVDEIIEWKKALDLYDELKKHLNGSGMNG